MRKKECSEHSGDKQTDRQTVVQREDGVFRNHSKNGEMPVQLETLGHSAATKIWVENKKALEGGN